MKDDGAKPRFLIIGLVVAIAVYLSMRLAGIEYIIAATAAITALTACYWITEALSIPVTSLIPIVAFPLFGVLSFSDAASGLGNHAIILLMGGFMMAKGLEKSGVHRRMALGILHAVGARGGKRIVIAFMLTSALLSMWISNTATALMLMPIALAVLGHLKDDRLNTPVVLGIAFACNVGGIATLVGTPPNVIFAGVYHTTTGMEFSFLEWMRLGLPVVLIGLPIIALWLTRNVEATGKVELPTSGDWHIEEKRVLAVFLATVFLWIFRSEPFGGWSALIGGSLAGDSTVALMSVIAMFLIPSGRGDNDHLLTWKWAGDIPWGMLLLFAGGITIAKAFQVSGLAELVGVGMANTVTLPPYLLILAICLSVTFLTEMTSNTATTTLLMPILAATAVATNIPPELLMIPAAMSASCAFMLPVATTTNAIAYGTGNVTVKQMAKEGFALNIVMAIVISGVCYFLL
jgi:solute carrier family 13 (sodium-dependent dicarboxylate transporter), member 2/3/5